MNSIKKYHLSHDGNVCSLYDTVEEAQKAALREQGWTNKDFEENFDFYMYECRKYGNDPINTGSGCGGYFIYEIEISESGELLKVDGQNFEEYLQENYDTEWEKFDRKKIIAYWTNTELELYRNSKAK